MTELCVSFSGMNLYGQCPSAFNRRYNLHEKVELPDGVVAKPSEAMLRGTRVHKGVEDFLLDYEDDIPEEAESFRGLFYGIRDERDATPEQQFCFTDDWGTTTFGDKENGKVRGMLDIAYQHDGTCHVFEIKTGKIYEEHAKQRNLYSLAGLLLYPETHTVRGTLLYLDSAIEKSIEISRDKVDSWKYYWDQKIKSVQPPQPYTATPSWKCKWCEFNVDNHGTCQAGSSKDPKGDLNDD
jgi:CRISPR/Cas system-associated exonuclease Cas4 (RecB family)